MTSVYDVSLIVTRVVFFSLQTLVRRLFVFLFCFSVSEAKFSFTNLVSRTKRIEANNNTVVLAKLVFKRSMSPMKRNVCMKTFSRVCGSRN